MSTALQQQQPASVASIQAGAGALALTEDKLVRVLQNSLYPGASIDSIALALDYCRASKLDPMQKPVHIVPMWDGKTRTMRDVIMPGIGLYRTQAARSGAYAGVSEPEFGPDVTESIGGAEITYPQWCKVTVIRRLSDGVNAEFSAVERWKENYAQKGGPEKSIAPNAMWSRRPYGQLAKVAEAQALRKAFPEIGAQPTAEEMEGAAIEGGYERDVTPTKPIPDPSPERTNQLRDKLGINKGKAEQGPRQTIEHDSEPTENGRSDQPESSWLTLEEVLQLMADANDKESFKIANRSCRTFCMDPNTPKQEADKAQEGYRAMLSRLQIPQGR